MARVTEAKNKVTARGATTENADDAFRERVAWHTLGIINRAYVELDSEIARTHGFEKLLAEHFGTGAAVFFEGHELIVTAKHVIEGASNTQIALMPRPHRKITWYTEGIVREFKRRPEPRIRKVIRCEWEDLAVIALEDGERDSMNVLFADLVESKNPKHGLNAIYLGHPFDKSLEIQRVPREGGNTEIQKSLSGMMTSGKVSLLTDEEAQFYRNFDPRRHFIIDFIRAAAENVDGKGFSGAGIWHHRIPKRTVWEPRAQLAGICTEQYVGKKLLKAVNVASVKRFLREVVRSGILRIR